MKRCVQCSEVKPSDAFYARQNKDGLAGKCKPCMAVDMAAYYQRKGKERAKARQRHLTATDPAFRDVRRDRMLRAKFGITLMDFRELLAVQDDKCAICGAADAFWHIDHDHDTGQIRAILCQGCNRGLGYFGDDADRLRAAAQYLDEHGANVEPEAEPARC